MQVASQSALLPAFKPASGLGNAHLQTILAKYLAPRRPLHTRVEMLQLPDKDELQLNWSLDAEDCSKPLVVLLHGLEGNIHSHYVRGMFHSLRQQGFGVVLMHFRGCHGVANKLPRAYHSGDTADFALFLQLCRSRYPNRSLLAVGFSLGGNVLVKYCGESAADNLLSGAVAVCAPLALAPSSDRINQGFSKVYQRYLLGRLKGTMLRKLAVHADFPLPLTAKDIGKIRSIRQFDDLLTAPLHGFRDAEHYYHSSSGLNFLPQVQKPLLLIHAKDDPFLAPAAIPAQLPATVQLQLCQHGGHVGFLSGTPWRPQYWLDQVVPLWLYRSFLPTGKPLMLIPWQQLNAETLQRLIESYVLREGTDYGDEEVSLADKTAAVLHQIRQGQVLILYSELHESVDLLTKHQYQQLLQNDPATE